jgi:hypothetical protein
MGYILTNTLWEGLFSEKRLPNTLQEGISIRYILTNTVFLKIFSGERSPNTLQGKIS